MWAFSMCTKCTLECVYIKLDRPTELMGKWKESYFGNVVIVVSICLRVRVARRWTAESQPKWARTSFRNFAGFAASQNDYGSFCAIPVDVSET